MTIGGFESKHYYFFSLYITVQYEANTKALTSLNVLIIVIYIQDFYTVALFYATITIRFISLDVCQ